MDYDFHAGTFQRIGKFVEVRRISRLDGGDAAGGFGTTYIARDLELDRRVVIKEFFPGDIAFREDNGQIGPQRGSETLFFELRQKFVAEARTLAACEKVVKIFDWFEFGPNSNAFMVMEFVRDDDIPAELIHLADPIYLESRNFPDRAAPTLEEVVHLQKPDFGRFSITFHRLLDAVQDVHARGIVHRDIKPSNVMMPLRRAGGADARYERHPVLIDFGASRKASSGRKRSTSLIYTPGYAPPEQASLHGIEGPWTDIFALAATAYFALSGRHPDAAMLGDGTGGSGYFQTAVGSACPPDFAEAMEWALQLDPAKRPQSVQEWRRKLPEATTPAVRQRWSRRQLMLGAGGVGGLVVAGGLGALAWMPGLPATVTTSVRKLSASSSVQVGVASALPGGQVAMTASGGAFTSNERTADGQRMVAGMLDAGNTVRALYRNGQEPSLGQCVLPLDDGGMVVGGCWGDPPYKALVVRVGSDGKEMWPSPGSPDAGAINRMALAGNRIHVVCGSPDAEDAATRAKLHVLDLDNGDEIGSGIDLSVRPHESVSRVAMLSNDRILTLSQRSRPNGMLAGVLAGYNIGGGEAAELWSAYSDEKWLNENSFKASQPTDFAVINGEAFVAGILIAGDDTKTSYAPYLLRFDCEHGVLRWIKAHPFGEESFAFPIRTVALTVAEDSGQHRLYAAYCPPEADGSYRQSRIVQIGPNGEALDTLTVGTSDQPFAVQSLAFNTSGGLALGYAPDGAVLLHRLTWQA